ncbi:sensor histidine kinase [Alkalihalobacillus sp. 1P02AB]|uniref:sensor histidine kinase n=1 Tax=Alkalihalobacillus sp. 1P02AB TaxID=3132260 RepID=UPI0039A68FBE
MFRNKEVRILLIVQVIMAAITVLFVYFFSVEAAIIVTILAILFIGSYFVFTHWRYREIKKLTGYLRKINAGHYSLDVRDNQEGELSILKNDIYKVTLRLSEYSSGLEKDKQKLTDAISDISHQIKTPLTSMTVMSDLLSNPQLDPVKRKEFTQNIQMQLERMDWLVSSLLKLSKIDAGTILFKKETINLHKLMNEALKPMLIPIELKEILIEVKGQEGATFSGDYNWTKEALINLIKNAVEHTPIGGKIEIEYLENSLFTELVIKDNGVGIVSSDLPYIFKRFYKGKNAVEGSVGIGLAMAHSIITSQKGDIEVHSEQGKGTSFFIKFYKQII